MTDKTTSLTSSNEGVLDKLDHSKKYAEQFTAKDRKFKFYLMEDIWLLGKSGKVDLTFFTELSLPIEIEVALRKALAMQAEVLAPNSIRIRRNAIKDISDGWSSPKSFQAAYHSLNNNSQRQIFSFLNTLNKEQTAESIQTKKTLSELISFINTVELEQVNLTKNIFDPEKGIYTDEEENLINEKLRLAVNDSLKCISDVKNLNNRDVHYLGCLIALILVKTIYRRPVQLAMLKWSDVLPIALSFKDHRFTKANSTPDVENLFSDVDQLHLRCFKAKSGYGFRQYAETRSIRLEPELSMLLVKYKKAYQQCLSDQFDTNGLKLNQAEILDLVYRCPLFPEWKLFNIDISDKPFLFKSLTHTSDLFHKPSSGLINMMRYISENLQLTSSRVQNFNITNNRSRHTVLTRGAEQGLSKEALSKITGVTTETVKHYIGLDTSGRCVIDKNIAGKSIFKQFSKLSPEELKKQGGFKVLNEFDEELGIIQQTSNCQTCTVQLCKPLGCYGCDNFRPLLEADHQANLERIELKIQFNQGNASSQTLKRLKESAVYIKATIEICKEHMAMNRGVTDGNK
jgi:hypothetical protein